MPTNLNILRQWMQTALPCIAGAREFRADRYLIQSIASDAEMTMAFDRFVTALEKRQTVAGLFVLSEAMALPRDQSATAQMMQLAQMVQPITNTPPEMLATGGKLNLQMTLRCPVTNQPTLFDDFDAVAFCPQSADKDDPLYDPMMAAPVPCVNINSDIYAFGMFTRDLSLKRTGQEVFTLTPTQRAEVFDHAVRLWQRYAVQTINGYVALTDKTRCPMGLVQKNTKWLAPHQDPAFAETVKEGHLHDMPILYAPRITALWERRLKGEDISPAFEQITPYGSPVSDK